MSKYDELPVFKACYDLLLEMFRFTRHFNREFKYTVGENLKKETMELMMLIYRANSKDTRVDILQDAREKVENIRILVRIRIKKITMIEEKKERKKKILSLNNQANPLIMRIMVQEVV